MTHYEARQAAGSARSEHRAPRRGRSLFGSLRAGHLLLGALMIAIPALSSLPADARDKGQEIQQRQADRSSQRQSSPPRTSSPPPQRSSPPPQRSSSPPPNRSSSPPQRESTPRRATPSRESGDRSSGTRSSRTVERRTYRDSHPGTGSGSSADTQPRVRTRTDSPGSSDRDGWRVRTFPVDRTQDVTREEHRRRGYDGRYDGRHDGRYDDRHGRGHDRYDHDRRGHRYSDNYYRHHRHHRYCGHVWGGYYDSYYGGYYGWGHYRTRGYYPWYWPWWPTIYVEADTYSANDGWGALDLDVSPEKAEIYLDGQYIGVADEYDGFPTYLWLEKGTYDVAIYYEGYETIFRQISIYPGLVIDVEDRMRRGESIHPDDYGPTSTTRRDARIERNREKEAAARAAEARAEDDARAREVWSEDSPTTRADDQVGRLYISVLPPDAAVYLDGHFLGTAAEIGQLSAGMVVEPGDHVIELVRPGYETYRKELVVPPGERTTVELELERD